jgi:hypothetical protein
LRNAHHSAVAEGPAFRRKIARKQLNHTKVLIHNSRRLGGKKILERVPHGRDGYSPSTQMM